MLVAAELLWSLRLLRGSTSLRAPMGLAPRMAPLVTITRTFGAFGLRFFDLRSRHLIGTSGPVGIGFGTDQITLDANRQDSSVERCVFHLPLPSGRRVLPACAGWDWLESPPAMRGSKSGFSSAAFAIRPREVSFPATRCKPMRGAGWPAN